LIALAWSLRGRWNLVVPMNALGRIGGAAAREALVELFHAAKGQRRIAAMYGLSLLMDDRLLPLFLDVLRDVHEPTDVRAQAAEAVGTLLDVGDRRLKRHREAVDALLPLVDDRDVEVRFWSVYALGMVRARRAVPALERLARNDSAQSRSMWWSVSEEAKDALHCIATDRWPAISAAECVAPPHR
jgi:HEAT repeat protein